MRRPQLRRAIERLALASLPTFGWLGCGTPEPSSARDLGVIASAKDLGCPTMDDPCFWLVYVDGGVPANATTHWSADGGADDACAPCGFATRPNTYCGQCEIQRRACGLAYFCSTFQCSDVCGAAGRRPPGLWLPSSAVADALGARLARMAHLEAASVPAFAQLAAELQAHGAPARLVAGARRARADEERHAEVVGAIARSCGARLLPVDVEPAPLRPLAAIAADNAAEGCVRETMGAVLVAEQARCAPDRAIGEALARIAADERRHANLSWAIDAWALPRLSPAERAGVERARRAAIAELGTT